MARNLLKIVRIVYGWLVSLVRLLWSLNPYNLVMTRLDEIYYASNGRWLIKPTIPEIIVDFFTSGKQRKVLLLEWINGHVTQVKVRDFNRSWQDGIALCLLLVNLHGRDKHLLADVHPVHPLKNCKRAMGLARDYFDVPLSLITAEEIAEGTDESGSKLHKFLVYLRWSYHKKHPEARMRLKSSDLYRKQSLSNQCIAKGNGLSSAVVNKAAFFSLYIKRGKESDISIKIICPNFKIYSNIHSLPKVYSIVDEHIRDSKNAKVEHMYLKFELQYHGVNRCMISYEPVVDITHFIVIKCNGTKIDGSPFSVAVKPPCHDKRVAFRMRHFSSADSPLCSKNKTEPGDSYRGSLCRMSSVGNSSLQSSQGEGNVTMMKIKKRRILKRYFTGYYDSQNSPSSFDNSTFASFEKVPIHQNRIQDNSHATNRTVETVALMALNRITSSSLEVYSPKDGSKQNSWKSKNSLDVYSHPSRAERHQVYTQQHIDDDCNTSFLWNVSDGIARSDIAEEPLTPDGPCSVDIEGSIQPVNVDTPLNARTIDDRLTPCNFETLPMQLEEEKTEAIYENTEAFCDTILRKFQDDNVGPSSSQRNSKDPNDQEVEEINHDTRQQTQPDSIEKLNCNSSCSQLNNEALVQYLREKGYGDTLIRYILTVDPNLSPCESKVTSICNFGSNNLSSTKDSTPELSSAASNELKRDQRYFPVQRTQSLGTQNVLCRGVLSVDAVTIEQNDYNYIRDSTHGDVQSAVPRGEITKSWLSGGHCDESGRKDLTIRDHNDFATNFPLPPGIPVVEERTRDSPMEPFTTNCHNILVPLDIDNVSAIKTTDAFSFTFGPPQGSEDTRDIDSDSSVSSHGSENNSYTQVDRQMILRDTGNMRPHRRGKYIYDQDETSSVAPPEETKSSDAALILFNNYVDIDPAEYHHQNRLNVTRESRTGVNSHSPPPPNPICQSDRVISPPQPMPIGSGPPEIRKHADSVNTQPPLNWWDEDISCDISEFLTPTVLQIPTKTSSSVFTGSGKQSESGDDMKTDDANASSETSDTDESHRRFGVNKSRRISLLGELSTFGELSTYRTFAQHREATNITGNESERCVDETCRDISRDIFFESMARCVEHNDSLSHSDNSLNVDSYFHEHSDTWSLKKNNLNFDSSFHQTIDEVDCEVHTQCALCHNQSCCRKHSQFSDNSEHFLIGSTVRPLPAIHRHTSNYQQRCLDGGLLDIDNPLPTSDVHSLYVFGEMEYNQNDKDTICSESSLPHSVSDTVDGQPSFADFCVEFSAFLDHFLLPSDKNTDIVSGPGLLIGVVGAQNNFQVFTDNMHAGPVMVVIVGPRMHSVTETSVLYTGDGIYDVTYRVEEPGTYEITVKCGQSNITQVPFICHVTY